MKKILFVFGTRPEAIKMSPLVIEFKKYPEYFETVVCVTGQHRKMLDQVLSLFEIIPDYDLDIMQPDQDLFDITSRVLMSMRKILKQLQLKRNFCCISQVIVLCLEHLRVDG